MNLATQLLTSIEFWTMIYNFSRMKKKQKTKKPKKKNHFLTKKASIFYNFQTHFSWYWDEIKLQYKWWGLFLINLLTSMHVQTCNCSKLQNSRISAYPNTLEMPLQQYHSQSWSISCIMAVNLQPGLRQWNS